MFRAQVLRRSFSLFNRVPASRLVQSAAQDGHETITVQRFRFHKPFLSKSRLVGALAISYAAYGLVQYLGLEVEVEVVEKKNKDGEWEEVTGEEEDEDEDEDGALLFLPTGLTQPKPRTFYKGSDPEWKEFKKIATDQERVNKIRGELVSQFRTERLGPGFVKLVGKIDPTKGKVWLEVQFPDGPPMEYERPGIELTDNLEWRKSSRPVTELTHHRMNRLLSPTAVGTALLEDTKRKAGQSWKGLKAFFGMEDTAEQPQTVRDLMQQLSATSLSSATPTAVAAKSSSPSTSPSAETASAASSSDSPAKDVGIARPTIKDLTLDLDAFKKELHKTHKPYHVQAPRGCLMVLGLIEIYGERARMTLQVKAAYDPKQGRYVGMSMGVFNLVPHRQVPKGGP